MRLSSPSRSITFFSVLFIAILTMASVEWRFMLYSKSSEGVVTQVGLNGHYMVQFSSNGKEFNSAIRTPYNIPLLELNEVVTIRSTLNEDGTMDRCYVSWFWSIFCNKILILLVLSLPWFAFVWSMPAKWTMTLGRKKEPKGTIRPNDPKKLIERNDQP